MISRVKFSTGLWAFGNQSDRFCTSGYKKDKSIEEMFVNASKVENLSGLEMFGTWHINEKNIDLIEELKDKYNFEIVSIVIDIFTQGKWGKGSFSSNDSRIREQAIEEVKKYMDIASQLNCGLVNIWPGQDGYDYCFQSDFIKAWNLIIDGLKECAGHRSDIRLAVEYKPKEPRTYCYIGTIGKTLALLNKIDKDNVGVTIDFGHALYAYENAAESVAICKLFGDKLFYLHLNDSYRLWDDDMMVGSIHIQEYLELIYWLKKTNYKGWYSLDIFPYREDGVGAASESIKWLRSMIEAVNIVDNSEIEEIINKGEAIKSSSLIRKMLFKNQ